MQNEPLLVAFLGPRRVATGPLREVLLVLKRRFDEQRSEQLLVLELETGRQLQLDLGGAVDEVLERAVSKQRRGPGRPRLGVTSREISLLPRHWEWLEQQSHGASGSLRRLVEHAMKLTPGKERARRLRAALAQFLSAVAGDRPNYEEASRALFGGDMPRFEELIQRWPKDIRDYAVHLARQAGRADEELSGADGSEAAVAALHRRVWSEGDYEAIPRLIAPRYVVHSDPGDPWDGQTLDRRGYEQRVRYSRGAFPDLVFTTHELVPTAERVAARWTATGTHTGDLRDLPATGRRLTFTGQTIYEVRDGLVAGHWQIVDRLGFVQQVRPR
jgi:predicted ester cyclase